MDTDSTEGSLPAAYVDRVIECLMGDGILVAFDGCHKIYIACDTEQADDFREDYPYTCEGTVSEMLAAIESWWSNSCGLRFVNSVQTNRENPNLGYGTLIPQGAEGESLSG